MKPKEPMGMKWRLSRRNGQRRKRWEKEVSKDRGAALIAALLVVVLVAMLGAVALQESLNGSHQGALTAKNLETASAGRAGVDAVLAGIQSVSASSVNPSTRRLPSRRARALPRWTAREGPSTPLAVSPTRCDTRYSRAPLLART